MNPVHLMVTNLGTETALVEALGPDGVVVTARTLPPLASGELHIHRGCAMRTRALAEGAPVESLGRDAATEPGEVGN